MEKSREINTKCIKLKEKLLSKNNQKLVKIVKRKDFLAVGSKFRVRANGLNLQARKRSEQDCTVNSCVIRVGFTCSKKVGNAVRRNRAKRRLRCLAREYLSDIGKTGWDYVLIGHYKQTEEMDFENLKKSFFKAVNQIHNFEKS